MGAQFIFTMHRVGKFVPPDREVLKDISLSFYPGAKIGVIGANGSGKSSLLRIMAGIDEDHTGEARLTPGFTVGLLEQEPRLDESKDVVGNVMDGVAEVAGLLTAYEELMARWSDPDADFEKLGNAQAELEARIEAAGGWDLQRTIDIAMDALRLPPGDAEVSTLSGGERRRVALCRLLLSKPDLLLLDEPTNHLDAESVAWLERFLQDYPGTVVAITHDRYFLDNVARWILELDHGKGHPFEGNYSGWLEQKQERLGRQEKQNEARRRTLERELDWVRMAPKARQAKSKARLSAYEELQKEAEEARDTSSRLEIAIPPGPRLGDQVIEASALRKGFGDRLLIEDLSFSLPRAGIVGVIGPNGAGKTTLFRMIVDAATSAGDPELRTATDRLLAAPAHRFLLTFAFGLVHGFGFASVLKEIGLSRSGLLLSLLSFNLGVELGQLLVVAMAFPLLHLLSQLGPAGPRGEAGRRAPRGPRALELGAVAVLAALCLLVFSRFELPWPQLVGVVLVAPALLLLAVPRLGYDRAVRVYGSAVIFALSLLWLAERLSGRTLLGGALG